MKVNIYYGGRGLIDDSTIYVMNKLTEVLCELRVEVVRYNLFEEKNNISMLPKTLKDADGVVLAVSMEWMGIGGYMQQFLDSCWLYGDKEKMKTLYMLPVVIASNYGERDALCSLIKAWEMLGGIPVDGLCAYVDNHLEFETNPEYMSVIEKKAEGLYRSINQKIKLLPGSINEVKRAVLRNNTLDLTPQESEQLSVYVSDDKYVKKQKEDIEELSQIFKEMLGEEKRSKEGNRQGDEKRARDERRTKEGKRSGDERTDAWSGRRTGKRAERSPEDKKTKESGKDASREMEYLRALKKSFKPADELKATYMITLTDTGKSLIAEVDLAKLNCYYGTRQAADVMAKTTCSVMDRIIAGEITLQKAFMSGELTAKGNFKTLRAFDTVFQFGERRLKNER